MVMPSFQMKYGCCDDDTTDCSGECGGTAVNDCAGICNGDSVEDCNEKCGGTAIVDCAGDCGGNAVVDECGICDGDNSTCKDCLGSINGDALEDKCGVCDSNTDNDCIQDCKGNWGGNAKFDQCGVCDGDESTCSGCMDETASNYDSKAKIDNRLLCDYDLVFEESSIAGYTDRDYLKIDYIYNINSKFEPKSASLSNPKYSSSSPSLSFGYEGDIYKYKNFLLSLGIEFMLGRTYNQDNLNFSLHSIYLSPILNFKNKNIALFSRIGWNFLSSRNNKITMFDYFQFPDSGLNLGIGIAFVVNDRRLMVDYNFHNIHTYVEGNTYNISFHRIGVSIYHNLISKLRDKK